MSKSLNCAWKSKFCPKVSYHTDTRLCVTKEKFVIGSNDESDFRNWAFVETENECQNGFRFSEILFDWILEWINLLPNVESLFFLKIPFQWILNFEFVPHRSIVNLQMPGEHASCGPKLENSGEKLFEIMNSSTNRIYKKLRDKDI